MIRRELLSFAFHIQFFHTRVEICIVLCLVCSALRILFSIIYSRQKRIKRTKWELDIIVEFESGVSVAQCRALL
jgi:hypothetical protein